MKHYTLAEHRTFCIESGIPNGEVWREVSHLGWLPEGIYHNPDQAFNPEIKARQKYYGSIPENKAKQKANDKKRQSTPEYKIKKKEYNSP